MKTKAELDQSILSINLELNKKFPELTNHIKEIPLKVSDNEGKHIAYL